MTASTNHRVEQQSDETNAYWALVGVILQIKQSIDQLIAVIFVIGIILILHYWVFR